MMRRQVGSRKGRARDLMGNVNETLTAAAISETAANVANALDLDRAVELVQEVCRIPSRPR